MKAFPLILVTLVLSVVACGQTSHSFTHGSGPRTITNSGKTYDCTAMQTFAPDGTFTGYLGLYFTVTPDGTFSNGHVYKQDAHGYTVLTADNFTGSVVGTNLSGVFSGANFRH
jgi:hypothetical protein